MGSKNHHHVPQVYLRQFVNRVRKNRGSKNDLWEFDVRKATAEKKSPKTCGYIEHFSSVALKDGTHDHETIEASFHPIENNLPKLFEAVRHRLMTPEHWDLFYTFVGIQEMRSPAIVSAIDDFQTKILKMMFEMSCAASPRFQERLRNIGVDPKTAASDFDVKSAKGAGICQSLQSAGTVSSVVSQMKWSFLQAPSDSFFVTSDHPLVRWLPPERRSIYPAGLADSDIECSFPISRKVCALGHWTKAFGELFPEVSAETVNALNSRTVVNAHHFVYGPTDDPKLVELIREIVTRRSKSHSSGDAA